MNTSFNLRSAIRTLCRGLAAVAIVATLGCAAPSATSVREQAIGQTSEALVAGDIVKISFPGAPELNTSAQIRLDGKISLPLIGEAEAAGMKLEQFQQALRRQYATQLQNKEVTVGLEAKAAAVYVSGAVNKPGKLVLERPMTAFEAIMEAGGIGEFGSLKKVHVIRLTGGTHQTKILNLTPVVRGKATEAFYLQAGDVVYVPGTVLP